MRNFWSAFGGGLAVAAVAEPHARGPVAPRRAPVPKENALSALRDRLVFCDDGPTSVEFEQVLRLRYEVFHREFMNRTDDRRALKLIRFETL